MLLLAQHGMHCSSPGNARIPSVAALAQSVQKESQQKPQCLAMNEAQRAQSILFNWFDTISEASSDFSSRYRLSSRSADALQAALPEEQLQMWSQRYRCPPRAASLDNLPRLKKLRDDLAEACQQKE
eukprot:g15504.t1